jgi:hypothetical protein
LKVEKEWKGGIKKQRKSGVNKKIKGANGLGE